ncbi:MAG TPA: hypothetical protein VGH86_10325 [Phenylobacterium sp.]|jgi:hypothetical protein
MPTQDDRAWAWPVLLPLIIIQLWAAHAVAFFAHEYAHAVVAWALGWKNNPLAIDYAKPSIGVFLIQLGINQNVDEAPIFAAGRAADVAMIGVAGSLLGNALVTYPLSRLGYHHARTQPSRLGDVRLLGHGRQHRQLHRLCTDPHLHRGHWRHGIAGEGLRMVTVDRAGGSWNSDAHGNVALLPEDRADHGDVALPAFAATRLAFGVLAVFLVFGFYGASGLLEGGPTSYNLSLASVFVALPLMVAVEFVLLRHRSNAAAIVS